LLEPSTVAENLCTASGASIAVEGRTVTTTWLITVIRALALYVVSARLAARTVTGLRVGRAPGD
jgi:hypothetical protein